MLQARSAAVFRALGTLLTLSPLLYALQDANSTQLLPPVLPAASAAPTASPSALPTAMVATVKPQFPDTDALLARIPETDGWESEAVRTFVKKLFTAEDYAQIEALGARLRTEPLPVFLHGFPALSHFYDRLEDVSEVKLDDPANASALPKSSRYRRWEAAFPESPIRPVAEASAWIDYAWQARGSGWAHTVTDEGWQRFSERLATARRLLETGPSLCPHHAAVFQTVALGQSWSRADYDALFERAVQAHPTYLPYYFRKAYWLLPRWHGEPGELQRWAAAEARSGRAGGGLSIYARIHWAEANYIDDEDRWKPQAGGFDWTLNRQAFEDLLAATPRSYWNRIAYARFAWLARDRDTFRHVLADVSPGHYGSPFSAGETEIARRWAGLPSGVPPGPASLATYQIEGQKPAPLEAHALSPRPSPTPPAPAALNLDIDWPTFLARHDLVWHVLPHQWNEGAFLGNGQLGLVAHARPADNRFDFHLGRVDVTDHRQAPDRKTSRGVPGAGVLYDFPRLHLGRMVLHPAGKITGGTLRQHLWDAELNGVIETDLGRLELRAVTLRDRMVHRVDIRSTERDPAGRPLPWRWEFRPGNPASPRAQVFPDRPESKTYVTNPPPRLLSIDGVPACVQPLLAGGDYATAWLDLRPSPAATTGTLLFTTANEVPAADASGPLAVRTLRAAASSLDADLAAHRAWWHAFYPDAFLTIPDARLESFYWIQIFKLAASSRPDAPPIDVLGPFYRITQWPGLWWNLNVQLTYWPAYAGNRLDLGQNLLTELDQNFDALFSRFATRTHIGDFAWVLHNYWLHLRHAGDWTTLHARWTPKARRVLADYLARLVPAPGGRLDLPATQSPEYEGFKTYHNSTYNLALLRWLLAAIPEAHARAGDPAPAADLAEWARVSAALAPYPIDEKGLMIGSDRSVHQSHRHFSHLLALYPLFQLDPDSPADRDLVVKSVRHWHHIDDGQRLVGYSFTGGASLYAALGFGDEAHALLTRFLDNRIGNATHHPNTFYTESGGKNPVIETPLSGASATTELLFQSWGGKLRVFPAVPSAWPDAAFHQLRGQGGFLVSSTRAEGRTRWVHVRSEAGEPCVIKVPDWTAPPLVVSARPLALETLAPGEYRLDLRRGESALLRAADFTGPAILRPLPVLPEKANSFGLTAATRAATDPSWPEPPIPSAP